MFQQILTPSAGKRLIAKAFLQHPTVKNAMESGTIAVIAGTTNGYVAEELLSSIDSPERLDRGRFLRGITGPPGMETTGSGRLPDESRFPGDVVVSGGIWNRGKTIFDVVDDLREGDVIVKGANCVDPVTGRAGVLIGHPKAGTIGAAIQAVVGRRVKLLVPVGLEKRVHDDVDAIAEQLNAPGASGPRLMPLPGEVLTEIEALSLLCGADARLVAAGGVAGAEGAVWLAVTGTPTQEQAARAVLEDVAGEEPFVLGDGE